MPETNNLLLFGGVTFLSSDDERIEDNSFYVLNMDNHVWSVLDFKGDYPDPRYLHQMQFFDNRNIMIFGGIAVESQIGDENPPVFGDLFMCDLDEMYISKPFAANVRPSKRYGHASAKMGDQPGMYIIGGLDPYCTMDLYGLEEITPDASKEITWEKHSVAEAKKQGAVKTTNVANKNILNNTKEIAELENMLNGL